MKTKIHIICLCLCSVALLASEIHASSGYDSEHNDDYFSGWTDEEYEIYEDSIRAALYPPVNVYQIDVNTHLKEAGQSETSTSNNESGQNISTSIEIDTTKEVGKIDINSDVSATGAKTYEVPIDVYPGIRGMEPHLALSYDSHQGNSIVGTGWRLSGISSIVRNGKDICHDSTTDGIRMNNNDSFWLDGVRLIKTHVSAECIQYESEQGNIKAKGYVTGNVMKYFEVFYPDGHKGVFGFTSNQNNCLVYPVSEYSDLKNNKISYSYTYAHSHYNISNIYYNGVVLEFIYEDRQDPILTYLGGYKVYESKLLKEITCRLADTEISTYRLNHSQGLLSSFLIEIHHSSDGKSYNPVKFFYGEGLTGYSYDQSETMLLNGYESSDTKMIKTVKGKFDYKSGSEGIAVLPNYNPYWRHHRNGTVFRNRQDRFDNLFSGDENIYLYSGLTSDIVSPTTPLKTGKGFVEILSADLDGNQEEYLIKINDVVKDKMDEVSFTVYGSGSRDLIITLYSRSFKFPTAYKDGDGAWSIQPKFYHAGDFDGDGRMEILAVSVHQPFGDTGKPSMCYVFDLSSGILKHASHVFPYNVDFVGTHQSDAKAAVNNSDRLLAMDCDGDGKTDICLINDEGASLYTFDISGGKMIPRKLATYSSLNKAAIADRDLLPCDFNGDGLPDFLLSPASGSGSGDQWAVFYSTGNGLFIKDVFNCTNKGDDEKQGFIVQDVNGDGKSDLIKYDNSEENPGFSTYLSRNGSLLYLGDTSYSSPSTIMVPTYLNSHNCFMQLLCLQKGDVRKFSFQRNVRRESLLTGMINSLGVIEKNEYEYIDGHQTPSSIYNPGADAVFPYVNLIEPIAVPASVATYVGGVMTGVRDFHYSNAVLHRQGKGFCGFEKISAYDGLGRMWSKEYDPYRFGIITREQTPGAEQTYTYDISTSSSGITRINLIEKKEQDLLKGISCTTTCSYDSYGYPIERTSVYSDGISVKDSYGYVSKTEVEDGYNLGFLTRQTTSTTRDGQVFTKKMLIPAHAARLPSVKIFYKNGNQVSQTVYTYDSKGNPLTESVKPYSAVSSQKTSYAYDSYGRLSKITDPACFSNSYAYDSKGRIKSLVDRHGKTTEFGYDAFGREVLVTYPDSTKKEIEYSWCPDAGNRVYLKTERNSGKPTETHYFDALERETRVAEVRFDGIETKIDRKYDNVGNIIAESLPHRRQAPQLWNRYEYDLYGRPTKCSEASGKVTTYAYEGNSTALTENGKTITRAYDSQGNLTAVTDPAGTIAYGLDPDGQISSLTAFDDITTSISYDKYRRRISVADPSLGTFQYGYDSAGNIASETDANGLTVNYAYDSCNRLIKKTSPELVTSYVYNNFGDLSSVTSDNGTSSAYEYDSFGRIQKSTETGLDGIWLLKEYTYSDGNIETITYTSKSGSLEKETRTYANGHLKEVVSKDGTVIFSLKNENAFGQPTEVSTAFITREYGYSDFGLPTRRKAYSSSETYQDISYCFDSQNHNLLSKSDNVSGFTESYTYDAFDRLTDYGWSTVSYDLKGNILNKSGVGTFQYGLSSKPYALTGAQFTEDAVPCESQEVTYASFSRPLSISEGAFRADFAYNAHSDRVSMTVSKNGEHLLTRHYLGGCYEYEKSLSAVTERLYLLGDYYSSPVVTIKSKTTGAAGDILVAAQGWMECFLARYRIFSGRCGCRRGRRCCRSWCSRRIRKHAYDYLIPICILNNGGSSRCIFRRYQWSDQWILIKYYQFSFARSQYWHSTKQWHFRSRNRWAIGRHCRRYIWRYSSILKWQEYMVWQNSRRVYRILWI